MVVRQICSRQPLNLPIMMYWFILVDLLFLNLMMRDFPFNVKYVDWPLFNKSVSVILKVEDKNVEDLKPQDVHVFLNTLPMLSTTYTGKRDLVA